MSKYSVLGISFTIKKEIPKIIVIKIKSSSYIVTKKKRSGVSERICLIKHI